MSAAAVGDSRISGENERRVLQRDPHPRLFRPLTLRSVVLKNRIALSPMCQYSAKDGLANDWHFVHLGARAAGGAGLIFTEAVHTAPEGRITKHCLGLWEKRQTQELGRIAAFVEAQGCAPGIQLGHAGRKASVGRPWEGTAPVPPEDGGWSVVGPSELPYATGWPCPRELSVADIQAFIEQTVNSVRMAHEAGFKVLEIHAAHGYLLHQFYSPLSNSRTDGYGGSFNGRTRLLRETLSAVRGVWPEELPIVLRLSCTDWVPGGWDVEDSINLVRQLREASLVDLVDCSSGGNDPRQKIPIHPGYQVQLARAVKLGAAVPTGAVGLIHSPDLAESIIASGDADLILLGRTLLADPVWPLRAAATLRYRGMEWPRQYERSNIF